MNSNSLCEFELKKSMFSSSSSSSFEFEFAAQVGGIERSVGGVR